VFKILKFFNFDVYEHPSAETNWWSISNVILKVVLLEVFHVFLLEQSS